MCGISGELRFTEAAPAAEWSFLRDLMSRRGPDDAGLWNDARCTLVFRRLAILDLTPAGHQPMTSADGRHTIVFNGEVYNFRELRRELTHLGHAFRSSGDTEVVLQALIQWGKEALARFNGMFALAWYDRQQRRLLLARDHVGIKPLYYAIAAEGVVFASQYDQILAHPWHRRRPIDTGAAGLYLRFGFIPAPFALLEGTHMLPAGSWCEFDTDGHRHEGRYFRFSPHVIPTLSGKEACEATDAAITAAVKRQLVSDVPLGAFLSGGIDSPLVVAKIAATGIENLHTFTIGAQGHRSDESSDAVRYARSLGVAHTVEHVSDDDALALLDDVIAACSEPFGDYSIFPTMLVSRLARRDYTVMLSGDGGDELYWGYPARCVGPIRHAGDLLPPRWWRHLAWLTRKLRGQSNIRHLRYYSSIGQWQLAAHTRLPLQRLKQIFPNLPPLPESFRDFDFPGGTRQDTAQWLRWNELTTHLTMVLLKVDRASMFESLEVRVPLLDREVLDVAQYVDWTSCLDLDRKIGKIPLRESLKRHVPFQTSGKKGFEIPMDRWLRTSLKEIFHDELLSRRELLGLEVDQGQLRRLYDEHCNDRGDYSWGLWPLLSAALWEKTHYRRHRSIT